MPWTTPDFVEIDLSGEVTAYVNVEDAEPAKVQPEVPTPPATAKAPAPEPSA